MSEMRLGNICFHLDEAPVIQIELQSVNQEDFGSIRIGSRISPEVSIIVPATEAVAFAQILGLPIKDSREHREERA